MEKQLQQKLKETQDSDEVASIKADLHIAEVDRLYTIYFPYMERYVSLYPVSADSKEEGQSAAALALHSERPEMWSVVEKAAEKGQEALEKLRERQLEKESRSKPPPKAPSKHSFSSMARTLKTERGGATKTTVSSNPNQNRGNPVSGDMGEESGSDDSSSSGFFEEG